MHELYIAQSILNSVRKSLPPNVAAEAVTRVRVDVGQLDAVVDETLLFLFDAIKAEQGFPAAQLSITTIPVRCRCRSCRHEFTLELPVFLCPGCGSSDTAVVQGRGIRLTGIMADIEDEVT